MPLRWRKRPQQAPSPFVEDEVDSLSREMNGTSHLGELPGFEGAKARGTIDQSPLILDVEIVFYSNSSSNDEEKASHGSRSSGFYANPPSPKPETKQEPKRNPLRHPSGESQSQGPGKPRPRSPSKPQDTLPKGELPMPDQKIPLPEMQQKSQTTPLLPLPNPPTEGPRISSSSTVKRSVYPRPTTTQHASGSTAIARTHDSSSLNHSPTRQADRTSPPSPGMSLRREQRETEDCSQPVAQEHSVQLMTSVSPVSKSPERPVPSTQPPGAWPSDLPSDLPSDSSSSHLSQFPTLEKTTEEAKPQAPTAAPLKSALRSQSLERTQSAPAQQTRRRTVSFAEKPLELPSQALVKIDHEDSLMPVQPRQDGSPESSRSTSPNSVAGYQDWHTIEGLEHLNICPSCVKQMRKSKFRDRITLSVPRPRTEPTLNKKLDDLDLLLQITLAPSGTKSCTGRIINDQYWYHIIDSETGTYLPQFNVCSASHRETFERCGTLHERACDFVPDSPRFIRYIDALDLAANRAEQEDAPPNLNEFLSYARRKVVLRDCRRSRLIFNTWHYMPQLPEFTVCEDCYDDIFSSAMRVLPGDKGSSSREASCQLYSPRIRAKFNDAVRRDDLPFLKWLALTRFDAEQRFRDRQDELLEDQRRGYECSGDLRKNLEDWKRYE
ncbi:hypothetical protein BDW59DRAFT_169953 [Aspergillus cavernicola]|uniref:Uncharacterized protein n=1 Tax=Aspergillus cavernicola TaxID=176166 RepID=A0ABR4ISL7_9EURO